MNNININIIILRFAKFSNLKKELAYF